MGDRSGRSPEESELLSKAAGAAARSSSRVGEQARGQARLDAAYAWSGEDWGKPPVFKLDQENPGETGPNGVSFGPAALRHGDAILRALVIHEGVHVRQIKEGNYGASDRTVGAAAAGYVNEAEAYRAVIENRARIGLSDAETQMFVDRYEIELRRLADFRDPVGQLYSMRILVEGSFALRSEDAYHGEMPSWLR